MDLPNKESLLQRYWKGETRPAEEVMLKELSEQHPELFSADELKYFSSLQQLNEIRLPQDFSSVIVEEDMIGKVRTLPKSNFKFLLRVAAAVLLCGALSWSILWKTSATSSRFADAETEEAYIAAKKSLALISQKMAKMKSVTQALDKFEGTKNKIKYSTQNN